MLPCTFGASGIWEAIPDHGCLSGVLQPKTLRDIRRDMHKQREWRNELDRMKISMVVRSQPCLGCCFFLVLWLPTARPAEPAVGGLPLR